MKMLYCDLVDTGRTFKNKKIYRCEKCGLEAGLDSPDAKILCFAKTNQAHISAMNESHQLVKEARERDDQLRDGENPNQIFGMDDTGAIRRVEDFDDMAPINTNTAPETFPIDSASQKQIDERMDICNSCEYYKNEACMLCGCRVVRDTVYQNKLADKSASCPDGRWGPITD